MRYVLLTLLAISTSCNALAASEEIDMKLGCKSNPKLIAACFSVHGRLSSYNGSPSLRIWPRGTHRLLGIILDEELLSVPDNIKKLVDVDKDIYGDFLVCPFTEMKPGHMQFVCVEEAKNVHVQNRP